MQILPLVEVHGAQERKSVGTITLVIWIFSVCQPTLKSKKKFMPEKNGSASIRLIIREENLSTRIMVFRFSQLEVSQELISMEDIEK